MKLKKYSQILVSKKRSVGIYKAIEKNFDVIILDDGYQQAEHVEILIYLPSGVSIDKTIDALYAFTCCFCTTI